MIQIKTTDNQIDEMDEWIRDETGWRDLDKITLPIRAAGFRGNGLIEVEEIKRRIDQRIKIGELAGQFPYPPRIEFDQTQKEFRFYVLWRHIEESPLSASDDSTVSPQPNTEG